MNQKKSDSNINTFILKEINTDNPVSLLSEDKFQRYEYAKRVATIISTTKHDKSPVVGVFGKWGEGKTSILNFIKSELQTNCITLEFNPWMFTDEKQLLVSFFFTLAGKLKKKLLNQWKTLGKVMSEYSAILGTFTLFFGYNSEKQIKNLGEKLNENSLDDLKIKLGNILKQEQNKIVVFIDDIDRLTNKEIQSVFKLVKNAGDFSNIVYVLAFDDEIVAKSLAPEYGDKDSTFGYKFLEKIIQIPLRIPKADQTLVKEYTYELIEKALKENNINLSQNEINEFQDRFEAGILQEIGNPRFSLRYSINISFILPVLKGEVNLIDLMLIEAIKVFKPEMYNFIRDNKQLFLSHYSSYTNQFQGNIDYKKGAKESIDEGFTKYSSLAITNLVLKLFSNLNDIFHTQNFLNKEQDTDPLEEKRINSTEYFDKYFQYTVPRGIIPDIFFDELLKKIENSDISNSKDDFSSILQKYKTSDVLSKLNIKGSDFDSDMSKKIIQLIAINNAFFPASKTFSYFGGIDRFALNFILGLFKKINIQEQPNVVEEFITNSNSCDFSFELLRLYNSQEEEFKNESISTHIEDQIVKLFQKQFIDIDFFDIASDIPTAFVYQPPINWTNFKKQFDFFTAIDFQS